MDSQKSSDLIHSHAALGAGKNLMKKLLAVSFLAFATILNSFSAPPPTSAEQLRSQFEAALRAKDSNAVLSLIYWKGVSGTMKSETSQEWSGPYQDVASVKLLPLPADYQLTNELNGIRYFPNVHVLGLISVESTVKGNAAQIPYGESEGAFYIAGTAQETFNPNAKKEKMLNISFIGLFPKGKAVINGSYTYVKAGEEITKTVSFTNSMGYSFYGDYIKSCKFTKNSGDGSIELTVTENTNTVFTSGMVETNDSISYEKKK
jgi:hypothetical protein